MLDFSEIRKIDGAVADAIVAELERHQKSLQKFVKNTLKFRLLLLAVPPERVSNAPLKQAQMLSASHHLQQWICSTV